VKSTYVRLTGNALPFLVTYGVSSAGRLRRRRNLWGRHWDRGAVWNSFRRGRRRRRGWVDQLIGSTRSRIRILLRDRRRRLRIWLRRPLRQQRRLFGR